MSMCEVKLVLRFDPQLANYHPGTDYFSIVYNVVQNLKLRGQNKELESNVPLLIDVRSIVMGE